MRSPRISVCATCYNHEKFLPEFLDSVLSQSTSDWELNVVDDCSTDGSFALLRQYAAKDPRIHVVQNDRNRHLCQSGSRSAAMATADLVTVISCDDMLLPGKLAYDCEYMTRHPNVGALYNEPRVVVSREVEERTFPLPADFSRAALLRRQLFSGNALSVPGLTIRREIWQRVGGYDPLLRMTQDYELHLKLLETTKVAKAEQSTVAYRLHENNLSGISDAYRHSLANESVCFLPRHYLASGLNADDLVAVIPECREYGEPCDEAVPYFLSRYALEWGAEPCIQFSGLLALHRFMADEGNRLLLESRYDFLPKDLMKISELPVFSSDDRDLLRTRSALDLLERSFSYRLGLALTCPLRKIYRFLKHED